MTSILLRCVNHSGYLPRIVIFNKNKRLVNFAIQHYAKPIVVLTRTLSQSTFTNKVIISEKIDNLNQRILAHKGIKKEELEDVIDHIQTSYNINNDQVFLLLQWCNNVKDCSALDKVKLMESLWFTLTICNFQLMLNHYNAILTLYVENNYDFSLNDLLMEMKSQKVYPDYHTYNMCMKYYCIRGKIKEAILLWTDYYDIFPSCSDESFLNLLLIGYSQLGNVEYINIIMNNMTNVDMKPTTEFYTSLMCAHAKLNDIDKIQNTMQTCHLNKMYFTNVDILKIIYTLTVNNHIEHINIIYRYLKKVLFISNKEIQFILELININQINIALNVFQLISFKKDNLSQNENMQIILKHIVDKSMTPNKVIRICNWFKNNKKVYKKLLLSSLYYSLSKDDKLSLSLLRICKYHFTIKPHYFWPLFKRKAIKYDFQGILDILEIMINEFHISPCVHTVTNYILPVSFNDICYIRNILLKYKVDETILNNAWVLMFLKKLQPMKAASYVQTYPGQYLYKILAHDLRYATFITNDIDNFINISCNLLEDEENIKRSTALHNNTYKLVLVPLDKQLYDCMIDCSFNKVWVRKVIKRLSSKNIRLKNETLDIIDSFLHERPTRAVNY